jgi:hypothetical protein
MVSRSNVYSRIPTPRLRIRRWNGNARDDKYKFLKMRGREATTNWGGGGVMAIGCHYFDDKKH